MRPVLRFYNLRALKTELYTDAAAVGLAAILLQADMEKDPLQLVYAISKKNSEIADVFNRN